MKSRRSAWEGVVLTVGTALAFVGSIAFVLPASSPGPKSSWVEAWTAQGGELERLDEAPDSLALELWRDSGLGGEPTTVRFIHPVHGAVAAGLLDEAGRALVYEASRHARLLHPAIGTADLRERGDFYVAKPDAPIERRRLD